MTSVYHMTREAFRSYRGGFGEAPNFPADYIEVATIDLTAVSFPPRGAEEDTAFELTNHIESAWFDNAGVTVVGERHHRSTSVGDVVKTDDGRVLRCEPFGWKEV